MASPLLLAGGQVLLLMHDAANIENAGEFEEESAVFPGESFSDRIDAAEVVAGRSADDQIEGSQLPQARFVQLANVAHVNHRVAMVTTTATDGYGIDLRGHVTGNLQ